MASFDEPPCPAGDVCLSKRKPSWLPPASNARRRSGQLGALVAALVVFRAPNPAGAWVQWETSTTAPQEWQDEWGLELGPGARIGHSMALYNGDSRLILFGGRSNDIRREHIPTTYEIMRQDGSLYFVTYDEKPVLECQADLLADGSSSDPSCSLDVGSGLFFNDVWMYDLACDRGGVSDGPCVSQGWQLLHAGSRFGGCTSIQGEKICYVPGERWEHTAAMFNDDTMIIYGGYSLLCDDYCEDVWSFDLRDNTWMQIYPAGYFAKGEGPGQRWKASVAQDGTRMFIFGGHRLWHGFASDNSDANRWNSTAELPFGGYLDDFWIYEKRMLSAVEPVPTLSEGYGEFSRVQPRSLCQEDPGIEWAARDDVSCTTTWPAGRAGHQAVWDPDRNGMWLHGGYRTHFPYIRTDGQGSAPGIKTSSSGFIPYPDAQSYLSDMWFFNVTDGFWTLVELESEQNPLARAGHALVRLSSETLLLFGGYSNNYHFDDTWEFDMPSRRWLEKTVFPYPVYPDSCTDDIEYVLEHDCVELEWSQELQRTDVSPWSVLPMLDQPFYFPRAEGQPGGGVVGGGDLEAILGEGGAEGIGVAPFAGTGPRQFVRKIASTAAPAPAPESDVTFVDSYEWCISVAGEPTRGTVVDGEDGRAAAPVLIPQPRRRAPGWDGCRDRADGRTDLPWGLMYEHPGHRTGPRAVYSSAYNAVLMYGGQGYEQRHLPSLNITRPTVVVSEMWQLAIDDCPSKCSGHGSCSLGRCTCDGGFYGTDCSNTSCPGDFCYVDSITREQKCSHCCHASWTHADGDSYVTDIDVHKVPCSADNPGESHGVCDGFGTCQCAPPFLGDDCSIIGCPRNCSFNGWCSMEFPVSRCMCSPGYFGEYCQYQDCLNNCTYPHGTCNVETGECDCQMVFNPYNNTRPWRRWGGEDCSYLPAFARAHRASAPRLTLLFLTVMAGSLSLLLLSTGSR